MKHIFTPLLLCGAALAHAEPPDPLDADAPTPPPKLQSALRDYQAFDEKTSDWRAANERVREIGGWRTYLREAEGDTPDEPQHRQHH